MAVESSTTAPSHKGGQGQDHEALSPDERADPETGRSLEQIEAKLRHGEFKPSDFAKPLSEDTTGSSKATVT